MLKRVGYSNKLSLFAILVCIALTSYLCRAAASQPIIRTLVVAEFRPNPKGLGDFTELFAYRFQDGNLESRRRLFAAPTHRADDRHYSVRFDLGRNFILADRYAVSGTGNVVDLESGRLLKDESDRVIEARPDFILFQRLNVDTGSGYLRLRLPGGACGLDPALQFPPGVLSPDLHYGLEINRQQRPYVVEIKNSLGLTCYRVEDTGFGAPVAGSSGLLDVPTTWTGNETLAVANCSREVTTLYEYNVKSGQVIELGSIEGLDTSKETNLLKDLEGNLILECSKGRFLVNRRRKELVPNPVLNLGHRFQTLIPHQELQPFYFQGRKIGAFHSLTHNAQTTDGYLAVAYGDPGSNLGYPAGFKVWNESTGGWLTFKVPFFCGFIGWMCER
ncbi:hypothetical protein JST97_02735 [bacterium]|nr:hypothetical protein [bacterium]